MKKTLLSFFSVFFLFLPLISQAEDTQILDELEKNKTSIGDPNFELKTFDDCESIRQVMNDFYKKYFEQERPYSYYRGGLIEPMITDDVMLEVQEESASDKATNSLVGWMWWGDDVEYSETNVQVAWVDESDIIKTDGEYIYYASESYNYDTNKQEKYVYIAKAYPSNEMELVEKIKIPDTFYNLDLYIQDDKLVILANGYISYDYSYYWIDRNSKSYVIVYDVSDKSDLKLEKLYFVDGNYTKSRRIGDFVYIISENYLYFPYYKDTPLEDFDVSKSIPKKIEITKTNDEAKQNLSVKGKKFPYSVTSWAVSKCSEIEYILPDDDTMSEYNFSPRYNIISIVNIADPDAEIENKVIFGNTSEIYMSLENLYITSHIYRNVSYACPAGAYCIMPYFPRGENTLIHKLNVEESDIDYQDTAMIPWNPLNQYSMDEYEWNFRIITSRWSPERQTDLYILDEDLKKVSSLEGLWKGENFQASRYIGDKLFLVTFEQIDPLFVIDLADQENPEILWELKIPWYSTYLHPYDENHIIWLGYDTVENQWGGTVNSGIKVDLYQVNYDKKCGDYTLSEEEKEKCESWEYKGIIVKQLYTKTFGGYGSYSEALNNPRMFIWNASRNMLLLPVSLYYTDEDDLYTRKDFFQGLIAMTIDRDMGIKEKAKITHIDTTGLEEQRQKDCERYMPSDGDEECRELIDGTIYCPPKEYYYVPEYCYKDSPIGAYLASMSWKFNQYFVKRALYIEDSVYSISDREIKASNVLDFSEEGSIDLK